MAEKWYPVIDYALCRECGDCIAKCSHGVYDAEKNPCPVVKNPNECMDHCHGCGNICPEGAIAYVGDDTGWVPPKGTAKAQESCCSGDCNCESEDTVIVEYMYLDLNSCSRCKGTEQVLDEAMEAVVPALEISGFSVEYKKILIDNEQTAMEHEFLSSPTIRVNGQDICSSVEENDCGCCSDISGEDVDCRVFGYKGEKYDVPPLEMLATSILEQVFGNSGSGCNCGEYTIPDNLISFFKGKKEKECSCGGQCC